MFSLTAMALHLLRHSDSTPPHLPAPPRSAVQTRAVLHGLGDGLLRWMVNLKCTEGALRAGHLLVSGGHARDKGYDELRRGDPRRYRPSSHVRPSLPALIRFSGVPAERFSVCLACLLATRIWYFIEYVM